MCQCSSIKKLLTYLLTWFDSSTPNSLFVSCNKYQVFRFDRCSRGGGVCVLVKRSGISVKEISLKDKYKNVEIVQ